MLNSLSIESLQARVGILQTEIKGRSLCRLKVPDILALRDPDAPVKDHPRFADFHGTVQHRKSLRQQILDGVFCRRQIHIRQGDAVDGLELLLS